MPAYPRCLLLLPVALLLTACGTEGELEVVPRCQGPALGLDGDWFGTMEDEDGTLFTLAWEICGDRIVRETISGISAGTVGSLRYQGSGSFSATLSDGTRLLMLTDPARRHAMVVSDFFEFAVLERAARALPPFLYGDLEGHWRGRHAQWGWQATVLYDASMQCEPGVCRSHEAGGVAATLSLGQFNPAWGRFRGSFADSLGNRGIAGALLSADLNFVGTYTCVMDYRGPEDCTFGALSYY
jgi:hypothetical protein